MGVRQERRSAREADIIRVAREHLARHGAAALSLRAIARDLGVASSAIYRYVDSRDELLTRLILRAFTALSDSVHASHDVVPREDLAGRWDAVGRAMRNWGLENPHDFTLIYGSPVPDYAAPGERTIGPGTAVQAVLVTLLDDVVRAGRVPADRAPEQVLAEAGVGRFLDDPLFAGSSLDPATLARGLSAWTLLLGAVTSELFHQLGPVDDPDALFEWHLRQARQLFLAS